LASSLLVLRRSDIGRFADQLTLALLQEAPQIETVRPYVKMACRAESLARVPFYIEKVKL
jgi:hypothetical protein